MSRSDAIRRQLSCGPVGRRPAITGFVITRSEPKRLKRVVSVESGWILVDGVKLRELDSREAVNWYLGNHVPNLYKVRGGDLLFDGVVVRSLTVDELADWNRSGVLPTE